MSLTIKRASPLTALQLRHLQKALLKLCGAWRLAEVTCLQLSWTKLFRVAFHHQVRAPGRSIWRERGKDKARTKGLKTRQWPLETALFIELTMWKCRTGQTKCWWRICEVWLQCNSTQKVTSYQFLEDFTSWEYSQQMSWNLPIRCYQVTVLISAFLGARELCGWSRNSNIQNSIF